MAKNKTTERPLPDGWYFEIKRYYQAIVTQPDMDRNTIVCRRVDDKPVMVKFVRRLSGWHPELEVYVALESHPDGWVCCCQSIDGTNPAVQQFWDRLMMRQSTSIYEQRAKITNEVDKILGVD